MKKIGLIFGIGGLTILTVLSISWKIAIRQDLTSQRRFTYFDSIIWRASPIAKVGEPVAGGGTYESIGDTYFLKSGTLLFWGQYGKKDGKDWALFSYKKGKTKMEFKAFEEFTEPDGVAKQFTYHTFNLRHGFPGLNKASQHFLYLYSGKGGLGLNSHIYGFDDEGLKKIIGEGDKIMVSGNQEVVVSGVRLERITNDHQAVIYFVSEKPKVRGWILHGKTGIKPLFNVGEEVPGLHGPKVRDFYGLPVYEYLARENNLYVFQDTLLAKLYVANASFKEGIFRITPDKTEILDSTFALGIGSQLQIIQAATGDNFIIRSENLYQYKEGNKINILEHNQTFSADKKGNPVIVKAKPVYSINSAVFLGQDNKHILLAVRRNDNNFEQDLYSFKDNNLTCIATIRPQPNNIVSPYLLSLRPAHNMPGVLVDNVFQDDKGTVYAVAPLIMTKNLNAEKGGLYFDGVDHALTRAPALATQSEDYFDYSNIIAQPDTNTLIVWRRPFLGNRDLFQLVK